MEPVTALTNLGIDRTTARVLLIVIVLICWLALLAIMTVGAHVCCYALTLWQRWRKDRRAMAIRRREQRWWNGFFV